MAEKLKIYLQKTGKQKARRGQLLMKRKKPSLTNIILQVLLLI